jgi:hypothetical protein
MFSRTPSGIGSVSNTLSVFIDGLLWQLEACRDGIAVSRMHAPPLALADDIVLVSDSMVGMRRLLDVCTSFASEHFFDFNIQKCAVMRVGVGGKRSPSLHFIGILVSSH